MQAFPDPPVPLICDMSSDIFSGVIDVSKFAMIYAGAQKNMGSAGMTLVIVSEGLLAQAKWHRLVVPKMLDYRVHAEAGSLYNTAPVFAIYTALLNLRWLKAKGGIAVQEAENKAKSELLYDALDKSVLFRPFAEKNSRSLMNVTFHLPDASLEAGFLKGTAADGIAQLKATRPWAVSAPRCIMPCPSKVSKYWLRPSRPSTWTGEFADIDHLIPAQTDHLFRGKLTTLFRRKLTTPNEALML